MASTNTAFEKIRVLGQFKSDDQVHAFIQAVRKYANHELRHKLIAAVMALPGAQCHDPKWIALEAIKSLQSQDKSQVSGSSNKKIEKATIEKQEIRYESCPICKNQVAQGALTTHYLTRHTREQALPKIRILNNALELDLLYSIQRSQKLAKQLSITIICPPVPTMIKSKFLTIEREAAQWLRCFERIPYPSELEELRVKVNEVRSAIDASSLWFEGTDTSKRNKSGSVSVYAIQSGLPSLGKRG